MNKQLIFCLECDSKSRTDYKYINALVKYRYNLEDNKISPVYMGGKFNFKHPKITNIIKILDSKLKVKDERNE